MSKCPIGIEYSCDECGLCDSNKKSNKPTNADKIRSMNDGELAEFITRQFCHGIGEKLILEWLQQPAK